ncbi:hypothetical protein SAMD00019534_075950, partial [Acytostelium subglobosum LB1]|uniref:hypothetical protein n=1 Tax=Acytostelium subglobosum LB1 TaxID=1410327 RepID=UPI000644C99F
MATTTSLVLDSMPNEVLLAILGYLSPFSLFNLSLVSRKYHMYSSDHLIWNRHLAELSLKQTLTYSDCIGRSSQFVSSSNSLHSKGSGGISNGSGNNSNNNSTDSMLPKKQLYIDKLEECAPIKWEEYHNIYHITIEVKSKFTKSKLFKMFFSRQMVVWHGVVYGLGEPGSTTTTQSSSSMSPSISIIISMPHLTQPILSDPTMVAEFQSSQTQIDTLKSSDIQPQVLLKVPQSVISLEDVQRLRPGNIIRFFGMLESGAKYPIPQGYYMHRYIDPNAVAAAPEKVPAHDDDIGVGGGSGVGSSLNEQHIDIPMDGTIQTHNIPTSTSDYYTTAHDLYHYVKDTLSSVYEYLWSSFAPVSRFTLFDYSSGSSNNSNSNSNSNSSIDIIDPVVINDHNNINLEQKTQSSSSPPLPSKIQEVETEDTTSVIDPNLYEHLHVLNCLDMQLISI